MPAEDWRARGVKALAMFQLYTYSLVELFLLLTFSKCESPVSKAGVCDMEQSTLVLTASEVSNPRGSFGD